MIDRTKTQNDNMAAMLYGRLNELTQKRTKLAAELARTVEAIASLRKQLDQLRGE